MIKLYNPKGDSVGTIQPISPTLERELNLPPTLSFEVDYDDSKLIYLEGLIKTEVGDYVVKEKKKGANTYQVICKPNFSSLQEEIIDFDFKTVTAENMLGNILGTESGWIYDVQGSEKRSLKIKERNKYDAIFMVADTFRYEIFFDVESKKIIMRNNIGNNTGELYIHDEVNLINLTSTADSYDIYTRIIPYGKDGLTIESVNGGKNYIDNFQYSNKIKPLIWKDERYEIAENLKEDAIKKLMDLSKPRQSYEVDIVNLYKLDDKEWSFLKLGVGDFVDLISVSDGVDIKQRIVKKISELGGDGTGDKVIIANLSRNFVDENSDDSKLLREAMELVDEVIRDTGEYLEADYNDKFKAIGDMIKGENGGYKVDRYNEIGQAYETLYLDNTDIDKAVNVIRLNKSGISFSTNGIDGPYNTAMTIDGKIAGKYVIVDALETITANLGTVTAGRVQDKDNESYWDLDSKEIKLNVNELKINSKNVATEEDVATKANADDVYTKAEMESQFTIRDGEISSKIVTEVTEQVETAPIYTWIKYADDDKGNGITDDPTGKPYMGIASGQTTKKESDDPTAYIWSKIEGPQGADGYTPVKGTDYFDGKDGQNGTSSYLWVRYSQNANGSGMTTDPTDAKYIGTATTTTNTVPAYTKFNWTLIKGTDGIRGEDGADGKTSYLHIKYSDNGTSFTANDGETVGKYIGTYVDFTKEDSMTFSKYTWNKVRGEDGYTPVKGIDYFDGKDGKDGNDGKSKYLHIRYSQTESGSSPTTDPANAKYIGVAVTESNTPPSQSSYNWTLIRGTDGLSGEDGADGKTSYLHIKYSNDGTTFTSNNGEDIGDWIGTYVDFIKEDSTDFNKYTWNRVVGKDGHTPVKGIDYFDGKDGRDGNDGISKYLHIRYSQTSNGANPTTNPADAKYIGVAVTESDSPPAVSLYKWTLIKGTDGLPGEKGADGKTSYLHIKYSNNGTTFTANNGETVGDWIGTYVDFVKTDSNTFSDYTWNKTKGEKGQSLVSTTEQYYKSTSNTTQRGGSWVDTLPTFTTGTYVWTRLKQVWANPADTTYTEPTLNNIISRVITVEDKVTDDAIISTVEERTDRDGDPFFARTSEVKQTVDNWTAKFSSIGGRNLLETDKFVPWGSGYVRTGYVFRTSGGIKIPNNAIQPLTEYVLSFKTKKISGTVTTMAGHTGSITPTSFSMDGEKVGTGFSCVYPNDTKEHQFVLSFVSTSTVTDWVYIQPNRPSYSSTFVMDIWDIQLEKGSIVTDWTPHPEELYTGITKIDKEGVTVGREGETIETNLGFDGLRISDGAIEIASFTGSGGNIKNLDATFITGDVINIMSSSTTFDIGTGTGYYADFAEVLVAIGNRKHLATGVTLTINIRSVLTETIRIEGFSGGGSIEINIYSRVNGYIRTGSNSCAVRFVGKNTTHVLSATSGGYAILSSNDAYVLFRGLNVDSKDTSLGRGIMSENGSRVYVDGCDFVNVRDALWAGSNGSIQSNNTKGNPTRYAALGTSGPIRMRGTIPNGTTYGFVETFGDAPRTASSFSPPATQTVNETRTFNHTDIYTYSVKYGARSTYYGKAAAQNRWDTSMTQMKGRIVFGSSVYSFIRGRNSGTTPTVKIRLRRQNSTHGASSSVAPTPEWSGAPSFGGATRGNWTAWVTIPYTLFTSSGYTFSFYNGSTGNSYAIWDRAEVQITRRITQ